MHVTPITSSSDMAAWLSSWNRLAGDNPFLRWEWLGSWWEHYARGTRWQLLVLVAHDKAESPMGFAPWFIDRETRTIQFLGSGKVCTDYLTLLCEPERHTEVAQALASWLHGGTERTADGPVWDQVELVGGMAGDARLLALRDACASHGMIVHEQAGEPTYCCALPATWQEYLQDLSYNGRRHARQGLQALQDDPRFALQVLHTPEDIQRMWPAIVDLHQRRRHSVGDSGCFDHPPFGEFLFDASLRMAAHGLVEIHLLTYTDRPVAFQYTVLGSRTIYTYQSGIDPDQSELSPGRMLIAGCMARAMERGYSEFDFMRGGEEYKKRWRGAPRASVQLRIIAPRATARLRHRVWLTGHAVKQWIKASTRRTP